MARVSKVDPCMICGDLPCTCGQVAKPVKAPVQRRKVDKPIVDVELPETIDIVSTPKKSLTLDAMKAMSKVKRPGADSAQGSEARVAARPSDLSADEKADLHRAIKVLEPLLHKSERVRYAAVLSSTPSLAERRSSWRSRLLKE